MHYFQAMDGGADLAVLAASADFHLIKAAAVHNAVSNLIFSDLFDGYNNKTRVGNSSTRVFTFFYVRLNTH